MQRVTADPLPRVYDSQMLFQAKPKLTERQQKIIGHFAEHAKSESARDRYTMLVETLLRNTSRPTDMKVARACIQAATALFRR
jgi:hypothetical protein